MSSTVSQPGPSTRREVISVLQEWLEEANDLAYHFGGTYGDVLGQALMRLREKEEDAPTDPSP